MPTDTPTLNLTPAQHKYLDEHGTLLMWVPMARQPKGRLEFRLWGESEVKCWYDFYTRDDGTEVWDDFASCHFYQDESVVCVEENCRAMLDVETNSVWMLNDKTGKTWPAATATLTTTPEPVRLGGVTEEQAEAMGYKRDFQREREDADNAYDKLVYSVMHDHPGITPGSWGWVFTVKKG